MDDPGTTGTKPAGQALSLKGRRGLGRLVQATRYSIDGIRAAWRHESAFRQECVLAVLLIPVALWLPVTTAERILMIGSLLLVLVVELLNSSIEAAVDRDSAEINALGKRAKDLASAAVMIALLLAAATWVGVLWAHRGAAGLA
jgi:diacylglycerol kinase (ATP)